MKVTTRNRGVAAIMAMMFLVIFGSLAAAMAIVSQGNLRTANTFQSVNRALAASETGIKYFNFRLAQIASTILTTKGEIDEDMADQLWPVLRDNLIAEMGYELHNEQPYNLVHSEHLILGQTPVEAATGAPTFQIELQRHPIANENYDDERYNRAPFNVNDGDNKFTTDGYAVSSVNPIIGTWVRIKSIGRDGTYQRSVQKEFRIDKKIRFAILSRSRVMIGRNVMIKGTVASNFTHTDMKNGHPVQMRDNFYGLNSALDDSLNDLAAYLIDNDIDGDNRVRVADAREAGNLADAATMDRNGDGYVDSYDLFLLQYDADEDGSLTMSEFSEGSSLVDEHLWQLINEFKYPAGTKFDWAQMKVLPPGESTWVDATDDMSSISDDDNYAKIQGAIAMTATKDAWEAGAAGGPYQNYFKGSIASDDPDDVPLTFDANSQDTPGFGPDDFDLTTYDNLATGAFADQVANATPNDQSSAATYTPASTSTLESVPFNSPHPYDYYERPIYTNYVFNNVRIPKGTNALFVNCLFIGVTFIETETDNSDPNYNYAGMQEADGSLKYSNLTALVNGEEVADTKPFGNNIRFHDCRFEGMVSTNAPQAFTHVRNKIQFTGKTNFDTQADSLSESEKDLAEKSTLMMPHFSVDMGPFIEPESPTEIVKLDGTIVAGILDVRGKAYIDGAIISTYEPTPGEGALSQGGNPANFNTTIGYFESSAGDAEAEIPDGGYGKIVIRYDPNRALPDGINGPIEVRADNDTYYEGGG